MLLYQENKVLSSQDDKKMILQSQDSAISKITWVNKMYAWPLRASIIMTEYEEFFHDISKQNEKQLLQLLSHFTTNP